MGGYGIMALTKDIRHPQEPGAGCAKGRPEQGTNGRYGTIGRNGLTSRNGPLSRICPCGAHGLGLKLIVL